MKASHFKLVIGLIIVVTWLGALSMTILLAVIDLMPFDVALETILIVSPVFSVYATLVVRDAVMNRHVLYSEEKLSLQFVVLTAVFTLFFSLATIGVLFIYYKGQLSKDELRRGLAALETCLGFCLGWMIGALFPETRHGSNEEVSIQTKDI